MTWFVESPWPALVLGLSVELILAALLVRFRRGDIVGGMIAVATLTFGLVVLERLVITNSEEIEQLLDELTASLVAGDEQAVLAKFTTDSPRVNELRTTLSHVTVRRARISNLEIRVDTSDVPTTAVATITENVEARDDRGTKPFERLTRKLKVTLHKEGGHWLVYNYAETDPNAAGSAGGGP